MPARAPLDVDLEDKLLYGLTPMRLGYVVIALLGGFALWSARWAAAPIRAAACLLVFGIGATFAWGRWRGRPVDGWLTDVAAYVTRTQRVVWDWRWVDRMRRRLWHFVSTRAGAAGVDDGDELVVTGSITTSGDEPDAEAAGHATVVAFPDAAVATG
jgi:hypothetical protein